MFFFVRARLVGNLWIAGPPNVRNWRRATREGSLLRFGTLSPGRGKIGDRSAAPNGLVARRTSFDSGAAGEELRPGARSSRPMFHVKHRTPLLASMTTGASAEGSRGAELERRQGSCTDGDRGPSRIEHGRVRSAGRRRGSARPAGTGCRRGSCTDGDPELLVPGSRPHRPEEAHCRAPPPPRDVSRETLPLSRGGYPPGLGGRGPRARAGPRRVLVGAGRDRPGPAVDGNGEHPTETLGKTPFPGAPRGQHRAAPERAGRGGDCFT